MTLPPPPRLLRPRPPKPARPGPWHVRDISDYQPTLDAVLERAEVVLLAVKAAEGVGWRSRYYRKHAAAAGRARLAHIPYLFCHPGSSSPAAQVANLVSVCGRRLALPPMVDVETNEHGLEPERFTAWTAELVACCRHTFGCWPLLYTNPATARLFEGQARRGGLLSRCPLWVADYGVPHPAVPWPWTSFALWQWTAGYRDPAIGSPTVDDSYLVEPLRTLRRR